MRWFPTTAGKTDDLSGNRQRISSRTGCKRLQYLDKTSANQAPLSAQSLDAPPPGLDDPVEPAGETDPEGAHARRDAIDRAAGREWHDRLDRAIGIFGAGRRRLDQEQEDRSGNGAEQAHERMIRSVPLAPWICP